MPPGGTPDPFFASVLLLLTLDDAGDTIIDYSGLNNPMSVNGVPGAVITQDATETLFGENTLRYVKLNTDEYRNISTVNLASPILATDDLVIEGWYRSEVSSLFTESPVYLWWQQVDGGGTPLAGIRRVAGVGIAPQSTDARANGRIDMGRLRRQYRQRDGLRLGLDSGILMMYISCAQFAR